MLANGERKNRPALRLLLFIFNDCFHDGSTMNLPGPTEIVLGLVICTVREFYNQARGKGSRPFKKATSRRAPNRNESRLVFIKPCFSLSNVVEYFRLYSGPSAHAISLYFL